MGCIDERPSRYCRQSMMGEAASEGITGYHDHSKSNVPCQFNRRFSVSAIHRLSRRAKIGLWDAERRG
ncbi:MAG TPA: hypothetical protein VGP68_22155, partial [Gemmataceae bacterium]|nr:hypothetical protein [Gemmataceae bacterium]